MLKFKVPHALYKLYPLSPTNYENFILAEKNESTFIRNRRSIWNEWIKINSLKKYIADIQMPKFKTNSIGNSECFCQN